LLPSSGETIQSDELISLKEANLNSLNQKLTPAPKQNADVELTMMMIVGYVMRAVVITVLYLQKRMRRRHVENKKNQITFINPEN
jgi:uncharacterized membrane protein YciS (DUF1049 family)